MEYLDKKSKFVIDGNRKNIAVGELTIDSISPDSKTAGVENNPVYINVGLQAIQNPLGGAVTPKINWQKQGNIMSLSGSFDAKFAGTPAWGFAEAFVPFRVNPFTDATQACGAGAAIWSSGSGALSTVVVQPNFVSNVIQLQIMNPDPGVADNVVSVFFSATVVVDS